MSTEQNKSVEPDEDVEGHTFHNRTVAAEDQDEDVQGHAAQRPRVATDDEDDVEGHGVGPRSKL